MDGTMMDEATDPPAAHFHVAPWPFSIRAIEGKARIIERFLFVAGAETREFAVEPFWVECGLPAGLTQCLTFTFGGMTERKVAFLTAEIERYSAGDADAVVQVDARINQLLE